MAYGHDQVWRPTGTGALYSLILLVESTLFWLRVGCPVTNAADTISKGHKAPLHVKGPLSVAWFMQASELDKSGSSFQLGFWLWRERGLHGGDAFRFGPKAASKFGMGRDAYHAALRRLRDAGLIKYCPRADLEGRGTANLITILPVEGEAIWMSRWGREHAKARKIWTRKKR